MVSYEKEKLDRHMRKTPCKDKGSGGKMCKQARSIKMPASSQKVGVRSGTDSLSQSSEGTNPAETFLFGLQASGTVRK